MKKTPKVQHLESMASALTALADRPAEISVTQLDGMAASLAAYEADGRPVPTAGAARFKAHHG